ncbi:hypothetical protein vipetofem_68 [Enterococcus phage vipetofem]|uniref:Uncharacterized protein n=1 Tax=Enterococcus phage vipetofem TaxID=2719594 RepID=A0A6G9LNT0_9CAUD|nr:hypothetical protein KNU92_gp072 [Enterococcus phage vipetofem]QIQ66366.1 hypothetical protein vipetofem_68 [Enterococcus phage vipetofem]
MKFTKVQRSVATLLSENYANFLHFTVYIFLKIVYNKYIINKQNKNRKEEFK